MFIPLRTNRPPRRRPIVTEALIILNLLVYLLGLVLGLRDSQGGPEALVGFGHLAWDGFRPWQLVTYQFLHDPHAIWHLAFNMVFLWVFGCAVEDRLGRLSYLAFYLIGGAVAGVAHMFVEPDAPVIGASGAIAGITGAFLALFPRSHIQVLIIFFFIGLYNVPSVWFVGFYFAVDVLRQFGALFGGGGDRVAFAAHIAGYLYGFALAFTLLALNIVKREEFDVFFLFKQMRRRTAFRAATRDRVSGPWESASADTGRQLEQKAKRDEPSTEEDQARAAIRAEIHEAIATHDIATAASRYLALVDRDPRAVLAEGSQLDVANQLQTEGEHDHAARAYERLLEQYPASTKTPEVRLILGLIYTRWLGRPDRASSLIDEARKRLTDPGQLALADQLLAEISS